MALLRLLKENVKKLSPTNLDKFNKIVSNSIIGSQNTGHIILDPHPSYKSNEKGLAFSLSESAKTLSKISKESAKEKPVILFGGIDFDNEPTLLALFNKIDLITRNTVKNPELMFTIYPETRQIRYNNAISYNNDKTFFSKDALKTAEDYLLPRFLSPLTKELTTPKTSTTLISFSIGAREICMAENAFKYILKNKYGCTESDVFNLLSYMNSLMIAYAVDYEGLQTPQSYKTSILSVQDRGVLNPKMLAEEILGVDSQLLLETSIIELVEKHDDVSFPLDLILLGIDKLPTLTTDEKINFNGHNLNHYIQAILETPFAVEHIDNLLSISLIGNTLNSNEID